MTKTELLNEIKALEQSGKLWRESTGPAKSYESFISRIKAEREKLAKAYADREISGKTFEALDRQLVRVWK